MERIAGQRTESIRLPGTVHCLAAAPNSGAPPRSATCRTGHEGNMATVGMIGFAPGEIQWLRLVIALLRHPDPVVGEVAREALRYLETVASRADESRAAG